MRRMPHIKLLSLLLFTALLFFCCSKKNAADEDQSVTPVSDSVTILKSTGDIGRALYKSKCVVCHGADGSSGIAGAANLQISELTEDAIRLTITNGRGRMPSFGAGISEKEIRHIATYVKTLQNK